MISNKICVDSYEYAEKERKAGKYVEVYVTCDELFEFRDFIVYSWGTEQDMVDNKKSKKKVFKGEEV